jgi:hypothetical protein
MRLNDQIKYYLKQAIEEKIPGAKLYLFGSRTNDNALGGDIDVMILTTEPIDKKIFRTIRIDFYKRFGWQKLDLVCFTFNEESTFRQLIQTNAIEL